MHFTFLALLIGAPMEIALERRFDTMDDCVKAKQKIVRHFKEKGYQVQLPVCIVEYDDERTRNSRERSTNKP